MTSAALALLCVLSKTGCVVLKRVRPMTIHDGPKLTAFERELVIAVKKAQGQPVRPKQLSDEYARRWIAGLSSAKYSSRYVCEKLDRLAAMKILDKRFDKVKRPVYFEGPNIELAIKEEIEECKRQAGLESSSSSRSSSEHSTEGNGTETGVGA